MDGVKSFSFLIKAVVYPMLVTIVIFLVWSIALTYGNVNLNTVPVVVNGTGIVGSFIAGFVCARSRRSNGLIMGFIGALLYLVFIFLFGAAFRGKISFGLSTFNFIKIIVSLLTGALGGIIAINMSYKKNKTKRKR